MISKPKIIVLIILFIIIAFLVWFLLDDHIRVSQREARRITMRYGFLVAGMDSSCMHMDFNLALGSKITSKLHMRVAFITSPRDDLFAGLEAGRYDIILSSIPSTPEQETAFSFSKPYLVTLEGDLFSISAQNYRLIQAINALLEEMFDDGTMLRISMDIFGLDMVTQAWRTWR